MGKLIYASPMSLDGFIKDGDFEWSNPGDEGHDFFTEVMQPVGTYLYGRKMYETMSFWESENLPLNLDPASKSFADVWQAAEKIVFSKTMKSTSFEKTRIENEFNLDKIREMKSKLSHDISIGGPTLAALAIQAGLVDEYQFFIVPRMIGNGIRVMPANVNIELELLEERRFGLGWTYLRYQAVKGNK